MSDSKPSLSTFYPHPPHLDKKQIGLWYARQYANRKRMKHEQQEPKELHLTQQQKQTAYKICDLLNRSRSIPQSRTISAESLNVNADTLLDNTKEFMWFKNNVQTMPGVLQEERRKNQLPTYQKFLRQRAKLPAFQMFHDVVWPRIRDNNVTIIAGATGCGKTTQIPQLILDAEIQRNNANTKIICTQPRRIAAVSVAQRVAAERADSIVSSEYGRAGSVGYHVKLEVRPPRSSCSIMFCTPGIILQWLRNDPFLQNCSYLILDEVHERDLETDFLMALAKIIVRHRPDLKLVLMSATMNTKAFSTYFNNAPIIDIPGRLHNVEELYLEDILIKGIDIDLKCTTGHAKKIKKFIENTTKVAWQFPENKYKHIEDENERNKTMLRDAIKEEVSEKDETVETIADEYEMESKERIDNYRLLFKILKEKYKCPEILAKQIMRFEYNWEDQGVNRANVHIVSKLIEMICENSTPDNGILIFVGGLSEIRAIQNEIEEKLSHRFQYKIFTLHSMLDEAHQRNVFNRMPIGVRKIVISTSMAETSITIDDITRVIDSGLMKEASFDDEVKANQLNRVWISQANANQRKGRAGRTQPGKVYRLYSRARYQNIMSDFMQPAMQREALDNLILRLCAMNLTNDPRDVLRGCLNAPEENRMNKSIEKLRKINAIDARLCLTPLGTQLNRMGVDPEIGKMVLFGLCFGCYRPIGIVAAALSHKTPFQKLNDNQKIFAQHKVRQDLAGESRSDLVAFMRAFEYWLDEGLQSKDFAEKNFLNYEAMKMIQRLMTDFDQRVSKTSFINQNDRNWDRNARRMNLLSGILSGVLMPNLISERKKHVITGAPVRISEESVVNFVESDCKLATFYDMLRLNNSGNQWTAWELNPCTDCCLLLFQKPIRIGKNRLQWFGQGRYEAIIPKGDEFVVDQIGEIGSRMQLLIMAVMEKPDLLNDFDVMKFFDLISDMLDDRPALDLEMAKHANLTVNQKIDQELAVAFPAEFEAQRKARIEAKRAAEGPAAKKNRHGSGGGSSGFTDFRKLNQAAAANNFSNQQNQGQQQLGQPQMIYGVPINVHPSYGYGNRKF